MRLPQSRTACCWRSLSNTDGAASVGDAAVVVISVLTRHKDRQAGRQADEIRKDSWGQASEEQPGFC